MIQINKRTLWIILVALVLGTGLESCKSKKKLAKEQAAQEYALKVDQAKQNLNSIINSDGNMSIQEMERLLDQTKAMNFNDPEILMLMRDASAKLESEKRIQLQKDKEAEKNAMKIKESEKTLDQYFEAIANAANSSDANKIIFEAKNLFLSPDIPVLIIISQSGNQKDYDRPTTISKYLNYIKDQKKITNVIENIIYDDNGKIVELELIKK